MSFLGGATWRTSHAVSLRASWPLVKLEIYAEGIRVGPSKRWFGWAVPEVELEWISIISIYGTRTGIHITRGDLPGSWILFQLNRELILNALSRYPVQVNH
jgi:hypothetical protein